MTPPPNSSANGRSPAADPASSGMDGGAGERRESAGRDAEGAPMGGKSAAELLEAAIDPMVVDMGFELLLLEWLGSGKRRVLRIFLDHADQGTGVTVADCTRMARIIGDGLDAVEANATAGEGDVDPALAALLSRAYTLEVSSPGVDRPLAKRSHFAAQIGARVKIKTLEPLEAESNERNFHGRLLAVTADEAAPDDPRRGVVTIHDDERGRTLDIPLPLIRRANLVWEG
ncbi:ribosome maturation factor RimP [Pseudenhygromyxa sp. WMMC2535]|uniref:ribosome maturation factor RimP n=1 Tax=Pseudenhygromyxa sp. WMMC2535 TaxID=2712867 RepID=UPI00159566B9|nr:ribosome maturation factor RimP [Pseudenhygromyxa sp. WMMC2535]NVB41567.1 ribosome maturation factor RimP [Pseudenhygromyxa sp. WMMC2535]